MKYKTNVYCVMLISHWITLKEKNKKGIGEIVESGILIFAGTTEGREIAEYLNLHKISCYVCVATEYGESLLPSGEYITVSTKRLDCKEIIEFIKQHRIEIVIDATHPYATVVTENITNACKECKIEYSRVLRNSENMKIEDRKKDISENNTIAETYVWMESLEDAMEYLKHTTGNILATTGSKELHQYTRLPDYKKRVFARVLSLPSVIEQCYELGFQGKNLIAMQGPFSEELNYAMLKQIEAVYLVTKESGKAGGFLEKLIAAERANVTVLIIGRQKKETGYSKEEIKAYLCKKYSIQIHRKIKLVGIGMGTIQGMTIEALEACKKADIIIGAKRMVEQVRTLGKSIFVSYKAEEIKEYIEQHKEFEDIVIVLSGDTGFYSGAKKLIESLANKKICQKKDIEIINGISSVVYFCGKLKMSWEDVTLMSLHGRKQNIIGAIKKKKKVFVLVGEKNGIHNICKQLLQFGLDKVMLYVGENLSYPNEKITIGTPDELVEKEFDTLSVLLIEQRDAYMDMISYGIEDDIFIRGKVPMTKSEIRSISISKLKLQKDSIVYDIGAGTGSVSVELAILAEEGTVYAIEKKEEAVELIWENKKKFAVSNLEIIKGLAPEAIKDLPAPTHVFIGGSSGNLKEIIEQVLKKNPTTRIVINAIALETISEIVLFIKQNSFQNVDIVTASIGKAKMIGDYHMMMGQNPVYIVSLDGKELE